MNKSGPSKFERWIFDSFPVTAEGLGLYRIFSALFILFFALPASDAYGFLSTLPPDFFSPPPGPMMLFEGYPPDYIFWILHYTLIAALLSLCVGFSTKTASIATGVLLMVLKGFIYSLGKINHDLLLAVVPLVMVFSGWGTAYSVDALRRPKTARSAEAWTLTLLALIIAFMMFTAGLPKILGGWLHIDTHATQGHYFKHFFVRGRHDLLAPYGQYIGSFWWELFDYTTVIFEVGFLVAIFNSHRTRVFICLAVLFHFSTMLLLNISFVPNFIAYAAFLNWSWVDDKIKYHFPGTSRWLPAACVAGMMLGIAGFAALLEKEDWLESDLSSASVIIIALSIPITIYHLLNISAHKKNN